MTTQCTAAVFCESQCTILAHLRIFILRYTNVLIIVVIIIIITRLPLFRVFCSELRGDNIQRCVEQNSLSEQRVQLAWQTSAFGSFGQ